MTVGDLGTRLQSPNMSVQPRKPCQPSLHHCIIAGRIPGE